MYFLARTDKARKLRDKYYKLKWNDLTSRSEMSRSSYQIRTALGYTLTILASLLISVPIVIYSNLDEYTLHSTRNDCGELIGVGAIFGGVLLFAAAYCLFEIDMRYARLGRKLTKNKDCFEVADKVSKMWRDNCKKFSITANLEDFPEALPKIVKYQNDHNLPNTSKEVQEQLIKLINLVMHDALISLAKDVENKAIEQKVQLDGEINMIEMNINAKQMA